MDENKSSVSKAESYREIGDFWDVHDVTDYWEQTEAVEFEVDLESDVRLVTLEPNLASKANKVAWEKGISLQTLLNLWVREKLDEYPGQVAQ
jgi:CopG antitoxin of type II toxin-antitoxin system